MLYVLGYNSASPTIISRPGLWSKIVSGSAMGKPSFWPEIPTGGWSKVVHHHLKQFIKLVKIGIKWIYIHIKNIIYYQPVQRFWNLFTSKNWMNWLANHWGWFLNPIGRSPKDEPDTTGGIHQTWRKKSTLTGAGISRENPTRVKNQLSCLIIMSTPD